MPRKKVTNRDVINIFREIALYLRAQDVAFKPQAYEVAAEGIAGIRGELADLYKQCGVKCIDDIPGVGRDLSAKIEELLATGKLDVYDKLKKKYPFDMLGISRIQDVGPKTVFKLYRALKTKTIADVERAAKQNKIASIPGMGKKSQDKILRGIAYLKDDEGRRIIHDVLPYARGLIDKLKTTSGITHIDIAGSLRRCKETIGDIDLLATTSKPTELVRVFKALRKIDEVLEEGPNKLMVRYVNGLQGDLLILKPDEYGAALVHFTGSREHNILLRERAKRKGMKLSEHGLFKGKTRVTSRTEEQVYKHLGLQFIPPEIRVGGDEIEVAAHKKIPTLIPYGSLKGDLQVQTDWSDGNGSIEEMAHAARECGLSYMAVTDHTKGLTIAHGLDEKRLRQQGHEIDRLNKNLRGFTILKSTECDVLKDGRLDLSDTILKTLDIVSISVHSNTTMNKEDMTERIIRALKHPLVNIFFHPTGRIVAKRKGYELDMDRVIRACHEYHVALEVNGSARLDLHETHVRQAIKAGVRLVINSDAHDPSHFQNLEYGIAQARRGWATKADVLNTKPLKGFLAALKKVTKSLSGSGTSARYAQLHG
ncbi:DNA polymerase/3'-5' exonuclease PolX [Patescibacteria group bacterium]|nr:MAG: DNA polymerase/3'-5' exonuclease PolX [Patescibacteria group bacterium]